MIKLLLIIWAILNEESIIFKIVNLSFVNFFSAKLALMDTFPKIS